MFDVWSPAKKYQIRNKSFRRDFASERFEEHWKLAPRL